VVVNVTDLVDPAAVDDYLHTIGRGTSLDDAASLAQDALDFDPAPAGAWTVLAHVAEHRGDYAGFERWTAAALGVDLTFDPSVEDDAYLAELRRPTTRTSGAAGRADHLLEKLDLFHGRVPQLQLQLDLCAMVLGHDVPEPTPAALDIADNLQFCTFLAFEGGSLRRFLDAAGAVLPPGERDLAESWLDAGVRHRHVRMLEQSRQRWKLCDVTTGEILVADTLIETWWKAEREGFVVLAPVGSKLAVVGEPILFTPRSRAEARAAMEDGPLAVARTALRWRLDLQHELRTRFCFPDLDPADVPDDEEALLELVRSRDANRAGRADTGDEEAEGGLLLEAIVAHRIISRRTPRTWDTAVRLVLLGMTRDEAWHAVCQMTYDELWERSQGGQAA
jgi:hypothetical protein